MLRRDYSESLRVEFEQRGGIVGGLWAVCLDAAQLPEEEARELERLVLEADLFNLPRFALPDLSTAIDAFEYDLEVTWGKRRRRIRMDDTRVPVGLRPLLNHLATRAGAT